MAQEAVRVKHCSVKRPQCRHPEVLAPWASLGRMRPAGASVTSFEARKSAHLRMTAVRDE